MGKLDNRIEIGDNLSGIRVVAGKLYIIKGLTIDKIISVLSGKVSRKTLYNWMTRDHWRQKRKKRLDASERLTDQAERILSRAMQIAEKDPTEINLKNLGTAQEKYINLVKFLEELDSHFLKEYLPAK